MHMAKARLLPSTASITNLLQQQEPHEVVDVCACWIWQDTRGGVMVPMMMAHGAVMKDGNL